MDSLVYQTEKETYISVPHLKPGLEVGVKIPMSSNLNCPKQSCERSSVSGGVVKSLEQDQNASHTMQPSRRRCPSPNSLARLEPKPPRVLEVNRGDLVAFKEVLHQHRLNLVHKMIDSKVIKKDHLP
jgi:hypothetical protein